MPTAPYDVAALLGLPVEKLEEVQRADPADPGNGVWFLWTGGGECVVLRRYHVLRTKLDLLFEAKVLAHLTCRGWEVPSTVAGPIEYADRLWAATRFVPGQARRKETVAQRGERGAVLAQLHADLRDLEIDLPQREGFFQGCDLVAMGNFQDWDPGVLALRELRPDLADWADAAMARGRELVAERKLLELPQSIVHGDFAEWNVHFGPLGVIDFDLAHVDSRSWEFVVARVHRSPELLTAYQEKATALGIPLSDEELAAIEPLERIFRINMVMAALWTGQHTGTFDLVDIDHQLARTGTPRP
ncbi:phosphotransferase enzyme family protein [Kribbella italica]|uniref:Homoserine kinase type II n=1 Tax=Kribbella italica TaxID=1540520 RepID=A0A7W9MRH9_9ACTN|nr:phosphotransferase [Kribbella italica]MBB5833641.1 homoserine kinase type II [Kribbella italica]